VDPDQRRSAPPRPKRLTFVAAQSLVAAAECVGAAEGATVGPQELLRGLVSAPSSAAKVALDQLGISPNVDLVQVPALRPPAAGFSAAVLHVVNEAHDEAASLESALVSTGHILLALVRLDREGLLPAARYDALRDVVADLAPEEDFADDDAGGRPGVVTTSIRASTSTAAVNVGEREDARGTGG